MSRTTGLTPDNRENFNVEDYSTGQQRENQKEFELVMRYRRLIIENDDPECEEAVRAMEKGWNTERGR